MESLDIALKRIKAVFIYNMLIKTFQSRMVFEKKGYFCSLGPHLEKTNKMITYDDQTSQDVSTRPVLRVCTCHVIKK